MTCCQNNYGHTTYTWLQCACCEVWFAHIKPAGLVLPLQVARFRFDRAAGKHDYLMRISWCWYCYSTRSWVWPTIGSVSRRHRLLPWITFTGFVWGRGVKAASAVWTGRIFDVDATETDQNELLIYSHFIQPTKLQPVPVIVECETRPWPSRSHKLHCLKLRHVGTVYACKFRQSP